MESTSRQTTIIDGVTITPKLIEEIKTLKEFRTVFIKTVYRTGLYYASVEKNIDFHDPEFFWALQVFIAICEELGDNTREDVIAC